MINGGGRFCKQSNIPNLSGLCYIWICVWREHSLPGMGSECETVLSTQCLYIWGLFWTECLGGHSLDEFLTEKKKRSIDEYPVYGSSGCSC